MSNFQHHYKKKTSGFGNASENRLIRVKKYEESRKKQRAEIFNEKRNVSSSSTKTQSKGVKPALKTEDRITRFLNWKAEREKRKKIEQAKKKPAFVVSVVRHKVYSPVNKDTSVAPAVKCDSIPKRITRATEKKLMNKALEKKASTKALVKRPNNINKVQKSQKNNEQSSAVSNDKIKASTELLHVPLFGRMAIQSLSPVKMSALMSLTDNENGSTKFKTEQDDVPETDTTHNFDTEDTSVEAISLKLSSDEEEPLNSSNSNNNNNSLIKANNSKECNNSIVEATSSNNNVSISAQSDSPNEPIFFSPYVVSSRGKNNARKEQQLKRGFSLGRSPGNHIPTKDTVMKTLNISVEEEERTAQYFQFLLNRETDRLHELCEKWAKIKEEPETTEDGQYEINQAIGQTNLLISKKFERFSGLVADCETGKGQMLVTCKDLQGFWDMMYMEVKNCDSRFEKLEKLRAQGWKDEESPISKPVTRKKTTAKKKVAFKKSNSIRTFLAQKKQKMAEQMRNNSDSKEVESNSDRIEGNKYGRNKSPKVKYKRSMSIGLNEQKFTPVKHDKMVQLSEISKKMHSPLTIIKVSQLGKTPEVQLDDSISYINSNQTPGKSILKQPKNSIKVDSRIKSTSKVNFDDHVVLNELPIDIETQTKLDLAAALSRIDNFFIGNFDEVKNNVERKLIFEDSSDECENDNKQDSEFRSSTSESINKVAPLQMQTEILEKPNETLNTSQRRNITRQNAVDKNDEPLNKTSPLRMYTSTPFKEIKDDTDLNALKQKDDNINDKEEIIKHDGSLRILRNRTVTPTCTPLVKRRSSRKISVSIQDPDHKENETPSRRKSKKSSLKISIDNNEGMNVHTPADNTLLEGNKNRRRSTRSVKFSEKEYSDGTNKPTLPMTPHVRSKIQSGSKEKNTIADDSISSKTPEKLPGRNKRSQGKKVQSLV